MSARKPAGTSWVSWIDAQVRHARTQGEFDDLPGHGQPIPDLDKPYDPMWWAKNLMEREDLGYLPESLQIKRDVEKAFEKLPSMPSERAVRDYFTQLNERIFHINTGGYKGPVTTVGLIDIEETTEVWRAARDARRHAAGSAQPAPSMFITTPEPAFPWPLLLGVLAALTALGLAVAWLAG